MKVAEILAPHLPANADRNGKIHDATCWRLFSTKHFSTEDEFVDSVGMLTALDIDSANTIAQLFGETQVQGSFTLNCNRLLHVNGMTFKTLMTIAKPNSLDTLINELLMSMCDHYPGFEGIHFSQDGVVFVKNPRKSMNCNSFKLAPDNCSVKNTTDNKIEQPNKIFDILIQNKCITIILTVFSKLKALFF